MNDREKNDVTIRLSGITKRFKLYNQPIDRVRELFSVTHKVRHTEKTVLDSIDLEVHRGEVLGIVGTNGAGKSTLLKIITGVLTPTSGTLEVNGRVAALLELGTGFNPEFTGMRNIYLNGTMMGLSHEEMEERVQSIVDFADIGDFINQPVKHYSSGMFARLGFAVAINVNPDILIVDEALSVGDLRFQMKCMEKMKEMMDKNVTVLFVSHDINAVRRLCTSAIWIRGGKIQAQGETNRVCDRYMDYLKLLDKNGGELDLPDVSKAALNADADSDGNQTDLGPSDRDENGFRPFIPGGGSMVAEIVGVKILNSKGEKTEEVSYNEPCTVEVYYDVYDDKVEGSVLGVALKRIDDTYICGLNTHMDRETIPWTYGRNCYKLVYKDGIRVLGGGYYFDVGLFDKTATVPIQYWGRIKEFMVTAPYVGEGIAILPHTWTE